ncbi:MAG: MBOAT family protein [Erysipelotrichales bacterium]|nr:MBOAT family protein [Erysipelotrichales bacterium]
MGLTNFTFFLFCFISLVVYYVIPKKYSYITLLLSSIAFLFYSDVTLLNIVYVLIILFTSYISGMLIKKYEKNKKTITIVGVLIILLELVFLKYSNLLITTSNILFKTNFSLVSHSSPLGLSYYSLMMIGYIINVYWGSTEDEKNILKLSTFMMYFPTLTSGPFIKYEDIKDELNERKNIDANNIMNGLIRSLWGLFKVLVISTRLNIFVSTIYGDLSDYNSLIVFLSILLYTFELYTNFSGSIDIIMGVSKMFGINLPENFNNPFASETITEFWRRWHITLGEWLRTYIFYPLLKSNVMQNLTKKCKDLFGKKGKKIPTFISMFILWVLIGIWHGGEYKYILASGILQFIFIFFEDITNSVNKKCSKPIRFLRILRTFILFSLSMVFFRAVSITEGLGIFKALANFSSGFNINFLSVVDYIIIGVSLIVLLVVDNFMDRIKAFASKIKLEYKLSIIFFLIIIVLLFGKYGLGFVSTDFIYGKF